MKPQLEPPHSGYGDASLVAFVRREPVFEWNWHYQPELELTWIARGRGTRLVGDHSAAYGPGDLVFLGANLPHTWFSAPGTGANEAVVVQFRRECFPEGLLELPEFVTLGRLFSRASNGLRFPAAVAEKLAPRIAKLPRLRDARRWLETAEILADLASVPAESLASTGYRHRRSFALSNRLERVTRHVEEHCDEELSLNAMARLACMTPGAFSRFFRKMTGKTFVEYRNSCRIREACRLLTETDRTIAEIAFACGFGNLANFNRRFRKEKRLVPREYRRLRESDYRNSEFGMGSD